MVTPSPHVSPAAASSVTLRPPAAAAVRGAWQRWRERRRAVRAWRRDLALLAGMSRRDLDDFAAPASLRVDLRSRACIGR